jgi:hypothetical protein
MLIRVFSTSFFARGFLTALMMEAVSISLTLVNLYEITRRNIPEGCVADHI